MHERDVGEHHHVVANVGTSWGLPPIHGHCAKCICGREVAGFLHFAGRVEVEGVEEGAEDHFSGRGLEGELPLEENGGEGRFHETSFDAVDD